MTNISQIPEEEILAYERVRLRLLALSQTHPGLLEIPIADETRKCVICDHKPVVELPDSEPFNPHYGCRSCGFAYTSAQANSRNWVNAERKAYRDRVQDAERTRV